MFSDEAQLALISTFFSLKLKLKLDAQGSSSTNKEIEFNHDELGLSHVFNSHLKTKPFSFFTSLL